MGLLEKLIKEGWWEKRSNDNFQPIDLHDIPSKNFDELYEKKSTIVEKGGTSYIVSIPADKEIEDLQPKDFEIVEMELLPSTTAEALFGGSK